MHGIPRIHRTARITLTSLGRENLPLSGVLYLRRFELFNAMSCVSLLKYNWSCWFQYILYGGQESLASTFNARSLNCVSKERRVKRKGVYSYSKAHFIIWACKKIITSCLYLFTKPKIVILVCKQVVIQFKFRQIP